MTGFRNILQFEKYIEIWVLQGKSSSIIPEIS